VPLIGALAERGTMEYSCKAKLFSIGVGLALILSPLISSAGDVETKLAGVDLGTTIDTLKQRYPQIYSHALKFGEILHEACNQKDLIVFTFTEEPWSPRHITYIWVRQESDSTVCRDNTGALPDYNIDPLTPRGIRIGDTREKVEKQYGKPTKERKSESGSTFLHYQRNGTDASSGISDIVLVFEVSSDRVVDISLRGTMPGAKRP